MAGGVASVIAAVALAFLLDLLSPVLRTSRHVERELDIRPVVIIPEMKRPRRGWNLFRAAPASVAGAGLVGAAAAPVGLKAKFLDYISTI